MLYSGALTLFQFVHECGHDLVEVSDDRIIGLGHHGSFGIGATTVPV